MKQHFVPKCYLKGFADKDEFVYTVDTELIAQGRNPGERQKSISAICIKEDYYNIPQSSLAPILLQIDVHDELYVESSILHSKEKKYQKVRDRLISGVNVTQDDFDFIADFIVQLKLRNIYWFEKHLKHGINNLIDHAIVNTLEETKQDGRLHPSSKDLIKEIAEINKLKLLEDHTAAKTAQLYTLIKPMDEETLNGVTLKEAMFKASWTIMEAPEDSDTLFITSDNPGFSLDINDRVHNSKFDKDFAFLLPLTSRYCLRITDIGNSHKVPVINKIETPRDIVRLINLHSSGKINKYLIGERRDEVKELSDFFKGIMNGSITKEQA